MLKDWPGLYRLQDRVLARVGGLDHQFYLSGGTALSRGYYHHRYSEDLDFFVNDAPEFALWLDRCFHALQQAAAPEGWQCQIILKEARFGRALITGDTVPLKLEFINDVPSRVGQPVNHAELGRLDTKENILANKLTALVDRQAPKDLADIFWLCCRDSLSIVAATEQAEGKAAGLFPPLVAAALTRGWQSGLPAVAWRLPPAPADFELGIRRLVREIMEFPPAPP